MLTDKQIKIFHSKYKILENGCWEWQAAKDSHGYGYQRVGSLKDRSRRVEMAHRISYLLYKGSPKDLLVCHKCDYPRCCNPEHLFLGTIADNNLDKLLKGRAKGTLQKGEVNHNAKLDDKKVKEILKLLPYFNNKEIAALYDVSHASISLIRLGKSWKHLQDVAQ